MTEYDYSPAAYERYAATQNRVSNWVYNQAVHAREYSSPFVPRSTSTPPTAAVARHHYRDPTRDHPSSSSRHASPSHYSSSHPTVHRSVTLPANHAGIAQKTSHSSSSRHPTRSQSHAPPSQPAYQQVYYQNTSPVSYAAPVSRGLGHGASYKTYTLDPNAQLVLPPVRPGETYVIVPPAGRKVEVVYDPASGSRSSRTSRSPTKKTGKPLLKRLLTLGSSADKGSSSSSRRDRRVSY
ncbi:unnamed protein product [Somion occarium]|uniref:DUF4774 domain-containing protein n=1 Tax=Somion occarium TaxID=3059160 RepID=A0ABP1CT52_9APHY